MADSTNHNQPDPATNTASAQTAEERIRAATIGEPVRVDGQIRIVDYDPAWPQTFETLASGIRGALGDRLLRLEHTGSTSIPGLAAKPIIDMTMVVADSSDEASYVPDLERLGYVLRIREPEWYEHRVLKYVNPDVNLHVFSSGSGDAEIERMLLFRDWLRTHDEDRNLYERTKRDLAGRTWAYVQNYADAKTEVVEGILARARAAREHDGGN